MNAVRPRVGFIGLGTMGVPMVCRLLEAGWHVTVFNRTQSRAKEVVSRGAEAVSSAREVAAQSDILFTMLSDDSAVRRVLTTQEGVLAGALPGSTVIDCSTISPLTARELAALAAAAKVDFLDAPVSGGVEGARAGTLSIMVGGENAPFDAARPVLAALATTITHCGKSGSGQVVKACNQVVVALALGALSEALVLGTKAGVAPDAILSVLGGGLAQSRVMDLRGPSMIRHDFAPRGKAAFQRKDLGIVLELARAHGVALPLTAVVDQLFGALLANGRGEEDHSAVLTVIEQLSNAAPAALA